MKAKKLNPDPGSKKYVLAEQISSAIGLLKNPRRNKRTLQQSVKNSLESDQQNLHEKDITVVLEIINGCDSKTKSCDFTSGYDIGTMAGIYGKKNIKLKKQTFHFIDGYTGESKIYDNIFCGEPGLPDCEFLTEKYQVILGKISLESNFPLSYGYLLWEFYSDIDKYLWSSKYNF
ncbi:hypothetical protein MXB_4655 [Myxobolus squamalis]|nr:hypothetical protein MXB_4655 [Myxobolus squamalis]